MNNKSITLLIAAGIGAAACAGLAGCGKKEQAAPSAPPPPAASAPAPATAPTPAPAPAAAPEPAASTDLDQPTPLPATELKGRGLQRKLSYYYTFNAGAGPLKITATAKNAPSGATNALRVTLQDLKANQICSDSWGNTTQDKTQTIDCRIEKAQPLILRLDLTEETIDYSLSLAGAVELPPAAAAGANQPVAGPGSTDIDAATRLSTNRLKGEGTKQKTSYFYAFNAGPGELTLTADGQNEPAAATDALTTGLYTLRNERICEISLGNTTREMRQVGRCKFEQRQPVILRVDLSPESLAWRVRFEGPYDFEPYQPPAEITIALDAAVLFDTGKWELKPEARRTLQEAAERIKKFTTAPVAISGHTDNVGNDAANLALSEKRAAAVKEWFVAMAGIPAARLTTKGYGKSRPVADNTSDAGRSRNRRVDVVIGARTQ